MHIHSHTCTNTCMGTHTCTMQVCAHTYTHTCVHTQREWKDAQKHSFKCVKLWPIWCRTYSSFGYLALLMLWNNDVSIVFYNAQAGELGNWVKKKNAKGNLTNFKIRWWFHVGSIWAPFLNGQWATTWIILKSLTCYLMDFFKLWVLYIIHF